MSVKIITGNIFTSNCQTVVNTVNCVGVMGAGIALEIRLRYPELYERYKQLCEGKKIDIGLLWIYKAPDRWVLNFPTKKHWKYPSKIEYLERGLEKFCESYKDRGISSIAFPVLGADKGGIPPEVSLEVMRNHLDGLDLNIEIYKYDPTAKDDLFDSTKTWLLSQQIEHISKAAGIQAHYVQKLMDAMRDPSIVQLNQLAKVDGIGIKTLERVYNFTRNEIHSSPVVKPVQPTLL